MNKKIYIVKYIYDESIEGYITKKSDFDKWLSLENKKRKEEGGEIYYKCEFVVLEVNKLQ